MQMEFEISVRLICWGDRLDAARLAQALDLELSLCTVKGKGEVLKQDENGHPLGFAKTGMLTYSYDRKFPESRRDPNVQFDFFAGTLKKISEDLKEKYDVESAELQVFIYYDTKRSEGRADFYVPEKLLSELIKHNVRMRITVLP